MKQLTDIERLCAAFAAAHGDLSGAVAELEDQVRALKRARIGAIRRLGARAADAKDRLRAAVEESPELWEKPRTRVMHGVKVGMQKGRGVMEWSDGAKVVARIRELYDDEAGVLIRTTETPNKDGLAGLPVGELKRLGITVTETDDQVVIKVIGSDIDKFVDALLKDDDLREAAA